MQHTLEIPTQITPPSRPPAGRDIWSLNMVKKGRSLSNVVWPSQTSGPGTRHVPKIGRNDACPCGSGKKYKDCHQSEGDAFLLRLAKEAEKQRIRDTRARLKEEGVSWWKRLFLIGR